MNRVIPFLEIDARHRELVGGKAFTLSSLLKSGFTVPCGVCIPVSVYREFIEETGLDTRIALELGRMPMDEMRWEEIWDTALRIRNLFNTATMPAALKESLQKELLKRFDGVPVAVRSSSPQEDQTGSSFAGLHESFINVMGIHEVLDSIRLVWASLWSDGALLYRRERGLSPENSSMAVIVQELVEGERSGISFSMSPESPDQAVVESVYGLNQGLVDGTVSPDRWIMERRCGSILNHIPAVREIAVRSVKGGTQVMPLGDDEKNHPPLGGQMLKKVFKMTMSLEKKFGKPQDVEWTIARNKIILLQSRPVTTLKHDCGDVEPWSEKDRRPWYLSLKRSFGNLKSLCSRIEHELLPEMTAVAKTLSKKKLNLLSDAELISSLENRISIHKHWVDLYFRELIPFAHGVRLFGQVYNDMVKPSDPYEFTILLRDTHMTALGRNRELQDLAAMIREDPDLAGRIMSGAAGDDNSAFARKLNGFLREYGDLTFKSVRFFKDPDRLISLLMEMANHEERSSTVDKDKKNKLTREFIGRFHREKQDFAREILKVARISYRLRDNDNIVLSGIEAQLIKAVDEGKKRLSTRGMKHTSNLGAGEVLRLLEDPLSVPKNTGEWESLDEPVSRRELSGRNKKNAQITGDLGVIRARQLVGQPAARGIAAGSARVVRSAEDLFRFKSGEILVCDSIDPNMTFIVPMAQAIVEQRGGMLVHGAIIAREYGLPCVTGVSGAVSLIETGDSLTVDGYLGIVTIRKHREEFM